MQKIKSNANYDDTYDIYSKLPPSDKKWFRFRFINSPNTKFRWVEYYNGNKAGFVELYDLEKNKNLNIAVAILPEYRGKGIIQTLVNTAEQYTNSTKKYNRIVWPTLHDNIASKKAAIKCGFKWFSKDAVDDFFIKDL